MSTTPTGINQRPSLIKHHASNSSLNEIVRDKFDPVQLSVHFNKTDGGLYDFEFTYTYDQIERNSQIDLQLVHELVSGRPEFVIFCCSPCYSTPNTLYSCTNSPQKSCSKKTMHQARNSLKIQWYANPKYPLNGMQKSQNS